MWTKAKILVMHGLETHIVITYVNGSMIIYGRQNALPLKELYCHFITFSTQPRSITNLYLGNDSFKEFMKEFIEFILFD